MHRFSPILANLLAIFVSTQALNGATAHPTAPTLLQLTQKSGYIFTGVVLSVERTARKAANQVEAVQIQFQVEQAIRGVSAKQVFTVREWMGLWQAGERYQPGERVLLFLYPTSKLGLTSPVWGPFGRFQLDANGQVLVNQVRLIALRTGLPHKPPVKGRASSVSALDLARAIRRVGEQ